MNFAGKLYDQISLLAAGRQVRGRVGQVSSDGVAAEVYSLALAAQRSQPGSRAPEARSAEEVAEALHPVDATTGLEMMVKLSVEDPASAGSPCLNLDDARRAAVEVAELLGEDAVWWTNLGSASHSWTPVTGRTFDGVVAAVAPDGLFAVLLQVSEE